MEFPLNRLTWQVINSLQTINLLNNLLLKSSLQNSYRENSAMAAIGEIQELFLSKADRVVREVKALEDKEVREVRVDLGVKVIKALVAKEDKDSEVKEDKADLGREVMVKVVKAVKVDSEAREDMEAKEVKEVSGKDKEVRFILKETLTKVLLQAMKILIKALETGGVISMLGQTLWISEQ